MAGIVIELTSLCNLKCLHCFDTRHRSNGILAVDIVDNILQNASKYGFDQVSFTGGEPTLHPGLMYILNLVSEKGYHFGFVTNGWNFTHIYEKILPYKGRLTGITFSLDGALEKTHDRIRGKGSYRNLMKAVSICMIKDIPFTFNTVITSFNYDELERITELAFKLGSRGIRYGHLISVHRPGKDELELLPPQKKEAEGIIRDLQKRFAFPVAMAPGYVTTELFPCDPLKGQELNIDWQGNVTICCHLSGQGNGVKNKDKIGNLNDLSFQEIYKQWLKVIKQFRAEKVQYFNMNGIKTAHAPCAYCTSYFKS